MMLSVVLFIVLLIGRLITPVVVGVGVGLNRSHKPLTVNTSLLSETLHKLTALKIEKGVERETLLYLQNQLRVCVNAGYCMCAYVCISACLHYFLRCITYT